MNMLWAFMIFFCFFSFARDPFFLPQQVEKKRAVYVLKGVCVTEQEPTAFVEYNGKVFVVGIGERVGAARVFAITDDRVTLHVDKGEPMTIFLK